jgi:hypothetical protein
MTMTDWKGLVLAGFVLAPATLAAQEPPAAAPPETPQATEQAGPPEPTELIFAREVFEYPTFARRNPFQALTGDEGGPQFAQLRLLGVYYSPTPSMSMAVVGTSTATLSADGATVSVEPGRSWYLRIGQSVGNIRVVDIRRAEVVVEVNEFGLTQQHVMQLETRRQGGTP